MKTVFLKCIIYIIFQNEIIKYVHILDKSKSSEIKSIPVSFLVIYHLIFPKWKFSSQIIVDVSTATTTLLQHQYNFLY